MRPQTAPDAPGTFSDDGDLPMTDDLLRRLRESGW